MEDPQENQAPTSEQDASDQASSDSAVEGESQTEVQGNESAEQDERQDTSSEQGDTTSDNLPEPAQKQVQSMLKRMHQATQEAAQFKRELSQYKQKIEDPQYQEYLKARQSGDLTKQVQEQSQFKISDQDWENAQTNPEGFQSVVNKVAGEQVNKIINQYVPVIQDLQKKVAVANAEREIDAFASQNPDFNEIDPRVMQTAIVQVGKTGGGLNEAYQLAKEIELSYETKLQSKMQKEIAKKKAAVTSRPSRSATPSVTYVNKQNALRTAFENAALGKKVDVRRKQ